MNPEYTTDSDGNVIDPTAYSNFDEDLMSEDEVASIWEPQYIIEPEETKEETKAGIVFAPRGKFYPTSYLVPRVERNSYIQALQDEAYSSNYSYYQPLNSDRIKHINRNDSIDLYTVEMRRVLPLFLTYYGKGLLFAINGFRSPGTIGVQAHSVGIAIDLKADSHEHADRIMNAAFMSGIPTIIPGGNFDTNEGYVHLDIAPKANYTYEAGYYDGPWT